VEGDTQVAEEEVDKLEGEALTQYISRLEALTGTERIRVPKEWIDKHGNVLIPPQAIYLVDTSGAVHESADNRGRLPVSSNLIGQGGFRYIQGTYTKGATGTTGLISVLPGTGDILIPMYGAIVAGGTRATSGPARFTIGDTTGQDVAILGLEATLAPNEKIYFPGLGELADNPANQFHPATMYQLMIPSATLQTADVGTAVSNVFEVTVEDMANTEVFVARLILYSMNDTAPTVTIGTSDSWA
jgi:hypothetical protein